MENITTLLEKYNNFKDAQIHSIVTLPDDSKVLTLIIYDDDGEEINTVEVTFSNINDSRILKNEVLPFLDMMNGISIIKEHDLYGFAVGRGSAMHYVHNAPLFIVSTDIAIEEK